MRFSPQAALDAQEEGRSWDTMEERPDGSLVVTFGATDLAWAARVALWYGPDVEVLEPVELRQRMKELATAIAARYRESKKDDAP